MGGERDHLEVLQQIASEMIPNGTVKCSYAELLRFKKIVDSFLYSRGDYQMKKAPDIKRELMELQEKVDGIFKLNHLQQQLEQLKDDTKHTEEQIISSINNGIYFTKFPYLNDYTKEQVLGWTRFLNDYHIDLRVCGIDDTCYLMKNFLYMEVNLKRTKKTIDVFKNVIRRSDMNQFRR